MQFNNPHQFPPSSCPPQQNPTSFNQAPPLQCGQNPNSFNQAPPLSHGQNPRFPTPSMPNFNNPSTPFNNFHGANTVALATPNLMYPPGFSNSPNAPTAQFGQQIPNQNMNQMMAAFQFLQQQMQFPGQNCHLGQLQNNNPSAFLQTAGVHNMPPNLNHVTALQMGQPGLQNPSMSGNPMLPFQYQQPQPPHQQQQLSPHQQQQPWLPHHYHHHQQQTLQQHSSRPMHSFNAPPVQPPQMVPNSTNLQSNAHWQPQVNHVANVGNFVPNVIPSNSTSNNFTRNLHGNGKAVPPNMRARNQLPYQKNAKGNMLPRNKNVGRGRQRGKEKNRLKDFSELEPPRPVPFKYTEKEVTQWREARKRNFPTKANIVTKLKRRRGKFGGKGRRVQELDEDSKLRRQQLKEVLAKQAELGVEVAEIPPRFFAEPKKKAEHGSGRQGRPKKPKIRDEEEKRSPTLLQKLLSSEIRRDKSSLLQVFRFMVLNSFFEQWPEKPLEFPAVTVEETGHGAGDPDRDEEGELTTSEENEREIRETGGRDQ